MVNGVRGGNWAQRETCGIFWRKLMGFTHVVRENVNVHVILDVLPEAEGTSEGVKRFTIPKPLSNPAEPPPPAFDRYYM